MRYAGALWALDPDLAYRRHFPAVNWLASFSLYQSELADWFATEVAPDMGHLRTRLFTLLQKQTELKEVVQIIGVEALQESDRLTLEVANLARETFLKQSIFNPADAFNSYEKQYWMLKVIFAFMDSAQAALKRGVYIDTIMSTPLKTSVVKVQDIPSEGFAVHARELVLRIEAEFSAIEEK